MITLNHHCVCPVRPRDVELPPSGSSEAADEGWESIGDSHIEPVVSGADQIDEDDIIDVDDDAVVQHAQPMPAPILPSKAVIESHTLTHWQYRKKVSTLCCGPQTKHATSQE